MMADECKTTEALVPVGESEGQVAMSDGPGDRVHRRQLIRFGVTGFVNLAIDLCTFSLLLYLLDFHLIVANSLAYLAGLTNSFLMNRRWTFAESNGQAPMRRQFPIFLILNLVGLGLTNLTVWLLATTLTPMGAKCVAVLVTYAWNFTTSRRFVFGRARS